MILDSGHILVPKLLGQLLNVAFVNGGESQLHSTLSAEFTVEGE